jgi:predicted GNAT family acetyltransferase
MSQASTTVAHDEAARRFSLSLPGGKAVLAYERKGDTLDLLHTSVPDSDEGQGHGSGLARAALDHARANKLKVIPSCPFVRAFIEKHPEYRDLVVA